MQLIRLFFRFIRYYFSAKTRYNVHSPFVFDFIEKVLEDNRWFYSFSEIEQFRSKLKSDKRKIQLTDFGAGSKFHPGKSRTIASLVRHSANRPYSCRLLFRIIDHYKPKTMLELGTSLGISTLYQSAGALDARMITIEGDPGVAKHSRSNFQSFNRENIQMLQGSFDEKLPEALSDLAQLDYAFIDGNHREEPTLEYFNRCLINAHDNSVFIFDDIHWSRGMENAWEQIKANPRVTLSIDLFFFGIVFFRKDFSLKEHYTLIKWAWKPWAIGLRDYIS